ncbi:hypothetical protein HJC06_28500 [Rhizobium sp. NLR9b]|uniref:hypothetical protein n=1 Tax=unclassified Rhizobium TaxID=2613769 RepID=UPI001C82F6B2|nr:MULTISPECIES: hypothetical protein [unclassified Rhizobium]MBX5230303.1 hypothetical protein [Rhizobium sp. NLR9b]MBX5290972.1 hypothetical protein [Rhizobium sp. NLR10b]
MTMDDGCCEGRQAEEKVRVPNVSLVLFLVLSGFGPKTRCTLFSNQRDGAEGVASVVHQRIDERDAERCERRPEVAIFLRLKACVFGYVLGNEMGSAVDLHEAETHWRNRLVV